MRASADGVGGVGTLDAVDSDTDEIVFHLTCTACSSISGPDYRRRPEPLTSVLRVGDQPLVLMMGPAE